MREFGMIVIGGLISAVLGGGFGWFIGALAPEFVELLAKPNLVRSPERVATALGAVCGLGLGALAMSVGIVASALRTRGRERNL
jgi:hypothetical protein